MADVTLILNYRKHNANAFNVLVGAMENAPELAGVELVFAGSANAVVEAARTATAQGRRTLVAWSFYSPQFVAIFKELNWVKTQLAGAPVLQLAGGVHATAEPEHTLRGGFDLAAVGEGETILLELLGRLLRGEPPEATRGIAVLKDGAYVSNGQGARVELDAFPPFAPRHGRFSPIEITRGCIYACKFCQTPFMFKARFRHRSPDNVRAYAGMMRAAEAWDVRFITPTALSYGSQDENPNLSQVEALLAGVRETLGPRGRIFFGTFPSEVRPEHVTPEALRMLKRYVNNDNLIIGGQSGSQRLLDASKRGHSVEAIVAAVRICLEEDFLPNVDFIFGLPGELQEDAEASLRLAEELGRLGARVHAHTFMPLPGTPYRDHAPAPLSAETVRQIERLASHGKIYGQWKQQRQLALDLTGLPRRTRAASKLN